MKDVDGMEMIKCNSCGYFGQHIGRLMIECCNGAGGCPCGGREMDIGECRVCHGTGWRSQDADTRANLKIVRALAEATKGFPGGGPTSGYWSKR